MVRKSLRKFFEEDSKLEEDVVEAVDEVLTAYDLQGYVEDLKIAVQRCKANGLLKPDALQIVNDLY